MELFNELGIDAGYVLLGALGAIVVLLILIIILMVKQSKLNKKYKTFMKGATGENLEGIVTKKFAEIDEIKSAIQSMNSHLGRIDEKLLITFQKVGIVKYNAFKEMGGKLSFAVALLNDTNDGFIINSMHSSREGCYTYIKEIIKGESFVVLAEEETEALELAMKSHDYMK
jgi:hypothetical protein